MRSQRWTGARAHSETSRGTRSQADLCGFADGAAVTWFTLQQDPSGCCVTHGLLGTRVDVG